MRIPLAVVLSLAAGLPAAIRAQHPRSVPVTFDNGGVHLSGTLTLPAGRGRHPAVVVYHAANGGTRDYHAYRHLVTALPAAGLAVLLFDRRGAGASSGDRASAGFDDLARDGLAGVEYLRSRPDIDPDRVGVWGVSQGGWLAPLAATLDPHVAFVIAVSGPGVSPAEQMDSAAALALRAAGAPDSAVARAMRVRDVLDAFYRGRAARDSADMAVRSIRDASWFPQAFLPMGGRIPANPANTQWHTEMDYDPLAVLARVRVPIAFFFGDHDVWVPVDESIANIRRARGTAVDSIWKIPDADHYLEHGDSLAGAVSAAYLEHLRAWLRVAMR